MTSNATSLPLPSGLPGPSLEHAPLPMATVEGKTHIVRYTNPAFGALMGQPLEQLIGKRFSALLPEKAPWVDLLERVVLTGKPASHTEQDPSRPQPVCWSCTMWPLLPDALLVGVMIQVTQTTRGHEAAIAMNEALLLGSLRQHVLTEAAENLNAQLRADITARQKTARELAEKARLLDLSHDAIIVRDLDGRISYWNHGAAELYGWSSEEALGKVSNSLFHTEFPVPIGQITAELHRTGRWTGELVHRKRDGRRVTVLVRKTLDRDSMGNPAAVLQNITDITERKQAEEALREARVQLADRAVHLEDLVAERTGELTTAHGQLLAEADERKRLEAEIAGAIEGERERLGQELHDGLVQELTGIEMMLHVLKQQLLRSAPAQADEAHRLCLMLQGAHNNARDLAKSFYPVELEQHGLLAALEGIAQRTQHQFGISCAVQGGAWATVGGRDATSVQLLRIAQEAVQNAAKHAHAKKILIHLSQQDGAWLLTVRDDGDGLGDKAPGAGGMGLRIMQYRARIIKGTLSVGNADGGGVLVTCTAPASDPR